MNIHMRALVTLILLIGSVGIGTLLAYLVIEHHLIALLAVGILLLVLQSYAIASMQKDEKPKCCRGNSKKCCKNTKNTIPTLLDPR